MKISIAIVTRNRSMLLAQCLDSLTQQTTPPFEVLVIDNNATDATKAIVFSFKDKLPIRYIFEKNIGIPYARNNALEKGKGDILAFLDDDCQASPNWIKEIRRAHIKYPDAVAIQGHSAVIDTTSPVAYVSQHLYTKWITKNLQPNKKIQTIVTSNVSFKLPVIHALGIQFDIRYFRYFGGEDTDFAYQLRSTGQYIRYWKKANIFFHARPTLQTFIQRTFAAGRAKAFRVKKWPQVLTFPQDAEISVQQNTIQHAPFYMYPFVSLLFFFYDYIFLLGFFSETILLTYIDLLGERMFRQKAFNTHLFQFCTQMVKTTAEKTITYQCKSFFFLLMLFATKRILKGYTKNYVTLYTNNDIVSFHQQRKKDSLNKPSVTVGIITRNRAVKLFHCLFSVVTQEPFLPNEIIVVDNGSTDETKLFIKALQHYFPFLHYVYLGKKSIPLARNTVIQKASSDILAFIDDDETVGNKWLLEIIRGHMRYKKAIALQGYSIGMPRNSIYAKLMEYYRHAWIRNNTKIPFDEYKQALEGIVKRKYLTQVIDTRNCSFKLPLLKKYNLLFDTAYVRGSDTDMGRRIILLKQQIIFLPLIIGYHWERESLSAFLMQNFSRGKAGYVLESKWGYNTHVRAPTFFQSTWNFITTQHITNSKTLLHYLTVFVLQRLIYRSGFYIEKYTRFLAS